MMRMITDEDLALWDAIANAATPGPWFVTTTFGATPEETHESGPTLREAVWTVGPYKDRENWVVDGAVTGYGLPFSDALFCATARIVLPVLIAEVRRLRESQMQAPTVLGDAVWSHPQILGGQLCVKGTRMPLWVAVQEYCDGMTLEGIADNHGLAVEQVQRALAWFGLLPQEPRRVEDDHR